MPLLVVGSIALDSVHTPTEAREDVLGGSAVYFSYAASYFTGVKLVGVVGEDWPAAHTELLQARNVDTKGLEIVKGGETFRWTGKYQSNMNDRDTLEVHLNVLEDFSPTLPEDFCRSPFLFLANGAPSTQMKVLQQMTGPKLVVADTMDLWIEIARDDLEAMLKKVDGLVLNDSEAKKLTEDENLVRAGRKVLEMGPKFVVLKKGEHGAMFFSEHETYVMPAYPTEEVVDPTGAGDSFAGGMMGYLAEKNDFSPAALKEAMAYGTVVASFNVEDFSLEKMKKIERAEVDARFAEYRQMLSF
ncbi:PfkB family carbohydrate kinase [Blastopirellula retiformator]|uniref:Putative sugar kinase YdjH n=1 Tax=Blastopirellula retiformator TaxID=2527970 RepID=A0A5C5V385_9BACT|nr:PfkB family carbohydrate kinase [Blastopirellula retiformator]TWT33024.1 putative sugar kinase YdjH [Blastopirellula retiformator]